MGKLLLNEAPLQLQASLAAAIGLNEAIVLQQLHWLLQNPNIGQNVDGRKYVHMSITEWRQGHFPFWSEATIQRTFANLEQAGLVLARADLNSLSFDRTKWYSIDLDAVARVEQSFDQNERIVEHRKMKNSHCKVQDASEQDEPTIPDTSLPETSSERSGATNAPRPRKNDLFSITQALSEVGGVDSDANQGPLFKEANKLARASQPPAPVPIRDDYDVRRWWCGSQDWRAKHGERVIMPAIRETWGQWLLPQRAPPANQQPRRRCIPRAFARSAAVAAQSILCYNTNAADC